MREGYEGGVWGRTCTDSYVRPSVPNAPMVRPVKHVLLSSSQFSEAFLVTTRPCLLKNQIMPPIKLCQLLILYDHLYSYLPSMSLQ